MGRGSEWSLQRRYHGGRVVSRRALASVEPAAATEAKKSEAGAAPGSPAPLASWFRRPPTGHMAAASSQCEAAFGTTSCFVARRGRSIVIHVALCRVNSAARRYTTWTLRCYIIFHEHDGALS